MCHQGLSTPNPQKLTHPRIPPTHRRAHQVPNRFPPEEIRDPNYHPEICGYLCLHYRNHAIELCQSSSLPCRPQTRAGANGWGLEAEKQASSPSHEKVSRDAPLSQRKCQQLACSIVPLSTPNTRTFHGSQLEANPRRAGSQHVLMSTSTTHNSPSRRKATQHISQRTSKQASKQVDKPPNKPQPHPTSSRVKHTTDSPPQTSKPHASPTAGRAARIR